MVTAVQLARCYDAYLASLHAALRERRRGLAEVRPFQVWVEERWRDDAPPEPAGPPAAVSAGGWGTVRWHEAGGTIRGYVPGLAGCYEVPAGAAPPPMGNASRRSTPARSPGSDRRAGS